MKMIFLWAIFGVVMISCNSSQKNNAPIKNSEIKTESQAHTSNLFGTYEGTLPAADCEGIKTILVINEDKTYTLKSEYIGREDATFEISGIYHIIGDSIMEPSGKTTLSPSEIEIFVSNVVISLAAFRKEPSCL